MWVLLVGETLLGILCVVFKYSNVGVDNITDFCSASFSSVTSCHSCMLRVATAFLGVNPNALTFQIRKFGVLFEVVGTVF